MPTKSRSTITRGKRTTTAAPPKARPHATTYRPFPVTDEPERRHELSEKTRDGVDAMGTEMAQAFVENATGADDAYREHRDEQTVEELGGPFLITTGATEFAPGTDASNPIDALREAFPTVAKPRGRGAL
jgi:hypothetical protein